MPHGSCYLVANGHAGTTYFAYCRKYSDAHETAFKAEIRRLTGYPCRRVQRKQYAPMGGVEINL